MQSKPQILIILIAGIGDLVLASKAMRAIKNGLPGADLHLLTSTEAAAIARHYKFLSHVWTFPVRELRKNRIHVMDILKRIIMLRKIGFQKMANLYEVGSFMGAIKMGAVFLLIPSPVKIGHDAYGFGSFLTERLPADTFKKRHIGDAMMDIAVATGGIADDKGIEVFWDRTCERPWAYLFEKDDPHHDARMIVGINPGGDRPNRRWDLKRYAMVADRLAESFKARILLLGGPGEEPLSATIRNDMKHSAVNLAGRLSLDELIYIISRLDLLLTNDSGPMHIGAATQTPLVALFGPEDPDLMKPYTSQDLFRIVHKDVLCRPCQDDSCTQRDCLNLITPDDVFDQCIELLKINAPGLLMKDG